MDYGERLMAARPEGNPMSGSRWRCAEYLSNLSWTNIFTRYTAAAGSGHAACILRIQPILQPGFALDGVRGRQINPR